MAVRKRSVLQSDESLAATIAGSPVQGAHAATADKDGVLADGAAVHGKREINGCAGMARCPLPEIWPRAPRPPPHYCDGCNSKFSIFYALDFKRGSLITKRHNKLRYGVADLSRKAFTPSHVRNNSLIFSGCSVKRLKANPVRTTSKTVLDKALPLDATE